MVCSFCVTQKCIIVVSESSSPVPKILLDSSTARNRETAPQEEVSQILGRPGLPDSAPRCIVRGVKVEVFILIIIKHKKKRDSNAMSQVKSYNFNVS